MLGLRSRLCANQTDRPGFTGHRLGQSRVETKSSLSNNCGELFTTRENQPLQSYNQSVEGWCRLDMF